MFVGDCGRIASRNPRRVSVLAGQGSTHHLSPRVVALRQRSEVEADLLGANPPVFAPEGALIGSHPDLRAARFG